MLPSGPFSVVIESDAPFAAERLMTWAAGSQRGAHGARAVQPSMTWYFAEGATFGPFESFYLLANPGDADATTVMRYLCRGLGAVTRTYTVPARGRTTIWVDQQGAPLDNAECGAHIEASVPIVAERSVYLNGPDGFTGGTATTGAPKLSTTWRFPAGETGDPYETFLLLANPSADAAFVDVHFQLTGGGVERRTYTVPARERLTAWVDQEGPVLAAASFSMVVEASVPIVAERAMWWRGDGASWVEGHVEVGAAAAATQWWLAHVPESATIVMLNETTRPGRVRMSPITQDGQIASIGDIELPPGRTAVSLTAIWPQLGPGVYGVTLESLPVDELGAVPFVAERTHRVPLRDAGTAIMGTPMP